VEDHDPGGEGRLSGADLDHVDAVHGMMETIPVAAGSAITMVVDEP
jgi:hypothetical protein